MTNTDLLAAAPRGRRATGSYRLSLATESADVRAAQRLRREVFQRGAAQLGPFDEPSGDTSADPFDDSFDDHCDHLIVWHVQAADPAGPESSARAVATCRLLPPHANEAAPRRDGLSASGAFGLAPLEALLDTTVEAGRACVAIDHRTGTVMSMLWGGVTRYLLLTGARYLLGCASVTIGEDGGENAAGVWDLVRRRHLAPPRRRCRPRHPLPLDGVAIPERPAVPPLLRGYLRLGAQACGPPALDTAFVVADFLVLLDLATADQRYLRYFLGDEVLDGVRVPG